MYSLVVPVYRNSKSIPDLLDVISAISKKLKNKLECVFVVDGNIENEFELLKSELPLQDFPSKLILHSRNFGSFAAIRTGLEHATGKYFCTMSADLQEPPQLAQSTFQLLKEDNFDIVIAERAVGSNQSLSSKIFWKFYRAFIQPDMPVGGVDMFGCNRRVRDSLLQLKEMNSSLVSLLFWVGYKRGSVSYKRKLRVHGKSAWTFEKKLKYLIDSIFSFSDLPIKLLVAMGIIGISISVILSVLVLIVKTLGQVEVPGYTATLLIVSFFSSLNIFSFGIIGLYLWRTFENTKVRPGALVMDVKEFK